MCQSTKQSAPRAPTNGHHIYIAAVAGHPVTNSMELAAMREARNEACAPLVRLPAPVQLMVLSNLSVLQLWRARAASRHFLRWATESLEVMPRLMSVGGFDFFTPSRPMADT